MPNNMKSAVFVCWSMLVLVFARVVDLQAETGFKKAQLKYPRVQKAYHEKEAAMQHLFQQRNIPYPPRRIFLRAFKEEQQLEVWIQPKRNHRFELLKTYPICRLSGVLGPKRRRGDLQVPEGFYYINRFNPVSRFHLSLGINYPNKSDKILGAYGDLGGDIFLHGGCVTTGCLPVTDEYIKEIYILGVEAKQAGQKRIPVHIFPIRLKDQQPQAPPANSRQAPSENGSKIIRFVLAIIDRINIIFPTINFLELRGYLKDQMLPQQSFKGLSGFLANLRQGYDFFEAHRVPPAVNVDKNGVYSFRKRRLQRGLRSILKNNPIPPGKFLRKGARA
ncbi:MAG: hypothetical protein GX589_05435 [Deltaproteobacteria bacterium]|nr:hypothetical protein [Deltaproteobacteria bacterium]